MYCSFYIRKGKAFLPTMARTEAGYWMGVEPVDVIAPASAEALVAALLAAIDRGNPIIQTPTRQNFPPDVMQRYCGLKSLSAFERSATCWAISGDEEGFRITEWRRSERYRGARGPVQDTEVHLPKSTPIESVVRGAAEIALAH